MHAIRSKHPTLNALCQLLMANTRDQAVVIPQGPAKGLRFRRGTVPVEYGLGIAEPEVQKACESLVRPGAVAYDIGANIGFYTILLGRLVRDQGQVFAFEPLDAAAIQAEENVLLNGMNHVEVVKAAVGTECGETEFILGEGSLVGRLASVVPNHADSVGSIKVPVVTLDHFVLQQGNPPPHFLKVDVEGGEVAVLQGMREVLQQYQPVLLCEMHGRNKEVAEVLNEIGYQTQVIECDTLLEMAPWNVHVVAWPKSE